MVQILITGALTDEEEVRAIIAEVGEVPDVATATSDQTVGWWAPRFWEKYAGKAQLDRQLQVLYTTRDCYRLKTRAYAEQIDFSAEQRSVEMKLSQRTGFIKDRIAELQAEIERLECKARKRRRGVTTSITTLVPLTAQDEITRLGNPPIYNSANDPVYSGDVYAPNDSPFNPMGGNP